MNTTNEITQAANNARANASAALSASKTVHRALSRTGQSCNMLRAAAKSADIAYENAAKLRYIAERAERQMLRK